MLIAGIALAGALGALARYLVDVAVIRRDALGLPVATLVINVTGSFVLGVLTGLVLYHALPATPKTVLGTGFCGAYTTFSTMQIEIVQMLDHHRYGLAGAYALCSILAGYIAICAATALVRRVRVLA